jgi:CheY-like chemotaxis protein
MADNALQILVVDDSVSVQNLLASLLREKGYGVTCASSGEEGLKKFHDGLFDLVLSDIILPGMSGLHLLKVLKENRPEVEVVMITSTASSFTAIKALRLGAYDYIVKPVDDHELLYNVVGRTLEKQHLANENRRLISDLSEKNRALQETLDMMKTLNRLCAVIASTLDIGEILRMLVDSAVERLDATKGYLLLLDKTGKTFSMKVSVGIDHQLFSSFTMRHDQGISGLTATENRVITIGTDVPDDLARRLYEEDSNGVLFTTPGIISVPLKLKDKVVGVVNISGRASGKPFTETETEFLTTLAGHAAIALINAGNFYRLKKND